mmetsp:Transcript_14572/g.35427  ORF Transcript_14572/g.35427 Transcript_14572/m.35427 type:complete len:275 (-) Transcript_14572:1536-2360(-)|eukprot:CAMPEP_0113465240 /NCGR_PEP_ID=MMETSP0014_2-20120614/13634_1 /TAXON_ID=2857 /ORGANISM="Nitzschia sp." /LENGTH=274 /DNA_ID=CAMNT_0000357385 /DNA_START=202 /DNA_END=1026 /DNA_ORIENTATION=- /assembly_acc=CAM_ASM_000159
MPSSSSSFSRSLLLVVTLLVQLFSLELSGCHGFQLNSPRYPIVIRTGLSSLEAKKGGKGFAKESDLPPPSPQQKKKNFDQDDMMVASTTATSPSSTGLTSIPGGSDARPGMQQQPSANAAGGAESVEDRNASILREKYGLRTREEQQAELKKQEAAKEQQQKLDEWRRLADKGEDFDLIKILPDPLLVFIDRFLKGGVAVCTVLFISAGLAITVEAGSKATKNPLPPNVDDFISNVVEPNFTPGLLVLLGFSVSLGAFAALQLSSSTSSYREDR